MAPLYGFHSLLPGVSWSDAGTNQILFDMAADLKVQSLRVLWNRRFMQPGLQQFDWRVADDNVLKATEQGLLLAPTVHLGNNRRTTWFGARDTSETYGPIERTSTSEPPADLTESWSSEVGYSASIYYFFRELLVRYGARFPYLAVGSEPNSIWFWRGTVGEYIRTLETVHKAKMDANVSTVILDGGIASEAWGVHIGREVLLRGVLPDAYVAEQVRGYYQTTVHAEEFSILTDGDIVAKLKFDAELIDAYDWQEDYLAQVISLSGTEALNFHYYESPEYLGDLIHYLQWKLKRAGTRETKSLVCHELGVKSQNPAYNEEGDEQAIELEVKVEIARLRGLELISWFGVTGADRDRGFKALHSSTGTPFEAAGAYRDYIESHTAS